MNNGLVVALYREKSGKKEKEGRKKKVRLMNKVVQSLHSCFLEFSRTVEISLAILLSIVVVSCLIM